MVKVDASSFAKIMLHTDFDQFIAVFLLPEVVSAIISLDYQCTIYEGFHLAWMSEPFGEREYPSFDDCPVLKSVQDAGDIEELKNRYDQGEEFFVSGQGQDKSSGPMCVHHIFMV